MRFLILSLLALTSCATVAPEPTRYVCFFDVENDATVGAEWDPVTETYQDPCGVERYWADRSVTHEFCYPEHTIASFDSCD